VSSSVDVVLVDFGDTLADERWMRQDSSVFPTWTRTYVKVVDEMRGAWDVGRMTTVELAALIAERLGEDSEAIHSHMLGLCRALQFNPVINAALSHRRQRGGLQAIVTVNPDLFSQVTDHYGLADKFDLIVTSWEAGTADKVELCRHAMQRLGVDDPSRTVLVDNLQPNVDGWLAEGGAAYRFVDDDRFARDVASGSVPGFLPSDVSL
jgi:FMN phosphatase YigB (HAD superfamily)